MSGAMNAPDHRPYLREGDLRTAEDVLAWLTDPSVIVHDGDDIAVMLTKRLDRERRQACRRQALARWRVFALYARDYARRKRDEGLICDTETEDYIERSLADALAFRLAARTP